MKKELLKQTKKELQDKCTAFEIKFSKKWTKEQLVDVLFKNKNKMQVSEDTNLAGEKVVMFENLPKNDLVKLVRELSSEYVKLKEELLDIKKIVEEQKEFAVENVEDYLQLQSKNENLHIYLGLTIVAFILAVVSNFL